MTPAHVDHARALIGTRWRHRGRGNGKVDCVGLLVLAFRAAGREIHDRKDYGREPVRDDLRAALAAEFGPPVDREPRVGDVALLKGFRYPYHVALFGDYAGGGLSLIHALNAPTVMAVCEQRFAGEWPARLLAVFDGQGVGR
jgi:cell wall-associated NlpC family hydrolase